MNNATAAIIALLLVSCVGADWFLNNAQVLTFLGKRLIGLIEYLAFWR